jgi:hypothetical protein
MAYDLRITRSTHWDRNAGAEILAEEWLEVIREDPELVALPSDGPYAARWSKAAWFDWFEGNVFTTDPDRKTVAKMIALAARLSGIVQGDNGEFYESERQWTTTVDGD